MRVIKIGRDSTNDYVVNNPMVSGFHGELYFYDNGAICYTDHSTNGTMINGNVIQNTTVQLTGSEQIYLPGSILLPLSSWIQPQNAYPAMQYQQQSTTYSTVSVSQPEPSMVSTHPLSYDGSSSSSYDGGKKKGKKGLIIALSIVGAILVSALVLCPGKSAHRKKISAVITSSVTESVLPGGAESLLGSFGKKVLDKYGSPVVNQLLDKYLTVNKYGVFSVGHLNIGQRSYKSSVGFFGIVTSSLSASDIEKIVEDYTNDLGDSFDSLLNSAADGLDQLVGGFGSMLDGLLDGAEGISGLFSDIDNIFEDETDDWDSSDEDDEEYEDYEEDDDDDDYDDTPATSSTRFSSGAQNWDSLLDSYEQYVDKYIDLMNKVKKGDISAMAEYTSVLEKAQEFSEKMEGAEGDMSVSQWARYMKITKKMASGALKLL